MPDTHATLPEQRICDRCGQKIPPSAKLAATEDGQLLCLACRIRAAQERTR
jgi:hypothetical protein